jgi:hypothetical protein
VATAGTPWKGPSNPDIVEAEDQGFARPVGANRKLGGGAAALQQPAAFGEAAVEEQRAGVAEVEDRIGRHAAHGHREAAQGTGAVKRDGPQVRGRELAPGQEGDLPPLEIDLQHGQLEDLAPEDHVDRPGRDGGDRREVHHRHLPGRDGDVADLELGLR